MFHSSKIIKYFFILHLFYSISNCQLTIPLTYFPVNKYNNTTPTEIMKSLILQRVYANIDIGTPRQTTQLPLIFDSNDFYIGYAPLKSLPEGRFRDMKCYNYNSSTLNETDMDSEDYYSYNGDMFVFGTYQRGEKAEEIHNIFQAQTYDRMVRIDNIKDLDMRDSMMRLVEVGVTPSQIFDKDSKCKIDKKKYYIPVLTLSNSFSKYW